MGWRLFYNLFYWNLVRTFRAHIYSLLYNAPSGFSERVWHVGHGRKNTTIKNMNGPKVAVSFWSHKPGMPVYIKALARTPNFTEYRYINKEAFVKHKKAPTAPDLKGYWLSRICWIGPKLSKASFIHKDLSFEPKTKSLWKVQKFWPVLESDYRQTDGQTDTPTL